MYKTLFLVFVFASCAFAASPASPKAKPPKNNIVRPCRDLDPKCVGDNLKANSRCSNKGLTLLPQALKIPYFRFETPYFNASYIDKNLVVQNLNKCYVSEFFYDLTTDVAVLSVDCPWLVLTSNTTLIQHKSLKEDTKYSFSSSWKYPMIRMTANFPRADAINVCSVFVFTEVVQLPTFVLTPNDKPTKNFLSRDLSFLNIYEREAFLYRGNRIYKKYINTSVCNYGCADQ